MDDAIEEIIEEHSLFRKKNISLIPETNSQTEIKTENGLSLETMIQENGHAYSVFTKCQKRFIVFMAAWAGFFSPLTTNIYFPALPSLARDFRVSSELINLTITSYMIFQGLSPTIFGDLGDMAGRRPAYIIGFAMYLAANIGLAVQNNYAALLVLRCLQSTGSSGAIALGNGVMADIAPRSERGTYIGIVASGAMIGPSLGPVLGGILTQVFGWHAIFWFLAILSGTFLVIFSLAIPETGRNIVGNGSISPPPLNRVFLSYFNSPKPPPREDVEIVGQGGLCQENPIVKRVWRLPNPLKSLSILKEKDIVIMLFFYSIPYMAFYCVAVSMPNSFQVLYGLNELQTGLCFL